MEAGASPCSLSVGVLAGGKSSRMGQNKALLQIESKRFIDRICEELSGFSEVLISDAKKAGAIVLYDPNFRKPHLKDLPKVKNYILYNIKNADIVKGSDEDFELIFGTKTEQETFEIIKKLNPEISFFYTKGALGSVFMRENYKIEFLAPKIEVVNTIGAGDNYNAGIIYGLVNYCKKFYNNTYFSAKKLLAQMPTDEIKKILNIATDFSQRVCQSSENYITV